MQLSSSILTFLKAYILLDTSLGKNYAEALSLISKAISHFDFTTEIVDIPKNVSPFGKRQHLLARRFVSHTVPTLLIYNHVDVVPAKYEHAFTPKVTEGKIFGRGASDQKGGTAGVLLALEKITTKTPRFNLIFWATTDEETDQLEQLRFMRHQLKLPQDTIVFDADTFAGGITIANLGMLQLEIIVLGKSVHSGMSHLGVNAIEQSALLITDFFAKVKQRFEAHVSEYPSFSSTGVKKLCSRCNVNLISGGIAANVIPDKVTIGVDCRFIPEVNVEEEREKLLSELVAFCKAKHIEYDAKVVNMIEGYGSHNTYAEKLHEIYKKVAGASEIAGALGSTPLAQWVKEQNLPHFGLGTIRGETNAHGMNEFCYIKDIENLGETLTLFLTA